MIAAPSRLARFELTLDTELLAGEHLTGKLRLDAVSSTPLRVELSTFWFADHKGLADLRIVARTWLDPVPEIGVPARFTLPFPKGPPTYAGELLSISWYVRVTVITGEGETAEDIPFRVHLRRGDAARSSAS